MATVRNLSGGYPLVPDRHWPYHRGLNSSDSYQVDATGAVEYTQQERLRIGAVWVTDFGTATELTTDATSATQEAIDFAFSTGARAVYFPALPAGAVYYYPMASASINPRTGLSYYGDGMYASILKWDEGYEATGSPGSPGYKYLFYNTDARTASGKPGLSFADMQFRGTMFDTTGPSRLNTGGPAFFLDNYDTLSMQRIRCCNMARIVTQCENIRSVLVTGCEFDTCMRDMARFRSSFNVVIVGNVFRHCDDDAIDVHQAEYLSAAGSIDEGIIIANNTCEDTGRIVCIGGRIVNITGNIMRRCSGGIQVNGEGSLEGVNQEFSVVINDNQVLDVVYKVAAAANIFSSIYYAPQQPRATAASSSVVPGRPVTATGVFQQPYAHRNSLVSVAANAIAPGMGVQICNNVIMRTLPAVAAYSQWGFGQAIDQPGWIDIAMTDAQMTPIVGIAVDASSIGVMVSNNVIQNQKRAIHYVNASPLNGIGQVHITNNSIYDCVDYGISMVGFASAFRMVGTISGNIFNIDPYHINSLRGAGGTWTVSSLNTGCGIVCFGSYVSGLVVEGNTFLNCLVPVALGNTQYRDNVLVCQPSVVGFNVANRGIGTVERAGRGFSYQIIDASPLSATYGALTNINEHDATSIPTTGFYVIGHIVHNTNPSVVAGWVRLTTGSAHVAGTDWKTIALT